jgi:hypothetical protein
MDGAANYEDLDISAIEYLNILRPNYSLTPRNKN